MLDNLKNNSNKFVKYFGLIVLSAFAITACSFNVSTATLEDVKTCTEVPENQPCASDISQFQNNTQKIFVTSDIKYAPEGTKIKIDWKYLGGETVTANTDQTRHKRS